MKPKIAGTSTPKLLPMILAVVICAVIFLFIVFYAEQRTILLALTIFGISVTFWLIITKLKAKQAQSDYERELLTKRYDFLAKYANDAILLFDKERKVVEANDKAFELYGYAREEMLGLNLELLIIADAQKDIKQIRTEIQQSGGMRFEALHVRKNGEIFPVEVSTRYIEVDGQQYYQSIIHDITNRKHAQEALEREQYLLRSLMDSHPDAIYFKDRESRIFRHSRAMAEKLSITGHKDIIGKTDFDLFSDEHAIQAYNDEQKIIQTGEPIVNIEEKETYTDRPPTWVLTTKMPLRDNEGNIIGTFGISRDITSRKESELALQMSRHQLSEAMDLAKLVHWEFDAASGMFTFDDRFYELYGTSAEREGGNQMSAEKYAFEFVYPVDVHIVKAEIDKSLATNDPNHSVQIEHRIVRRDGEIRYIIVRVRVMKDETGKTIKTYGVNQDITERKKIEQELAKRNEELTRSNAELEQFAYVASHDLQEPLRMVASYTQLLARRYKDKLDDSANEFINFAVDGANRMQTLINDLLAFSRIGTRGKLFAPVNCQKVIAQAIHNLKLSIEESKATVNFDQLPTVYADDQQLVQLFQNLIGNAVKYHSDKPPLITISAKREDDDWIFSVNDNGIGIEPKYFERIFVIFQRLHGMHEYSGTGIGLAICKKIVTRHGGLIWVDSKPGDGTAFYFTLPARLVDAT
jgi:PAS domain S-box-containing protein